MTHGLRSARRKLLRAMAAAPLLLAAATARAQPQAGAIQSLLANASDQALDRLAQPGAFSADEAIRIALPGLGGGGKALNDLMGLAGKAGLTGDLNGALNRAAEQAAAQAKPIFRAAIEKLSLSELAGLVTGGDTAATDYLRKSTGSEIQGKLLPLVRQALDASGALKQTQQLSALGMGEDKLAGYVAGKTADGIFTYVGREEAKARKDPIGTGTRLLQGLKF